MSDASVYWRAAKIAWEHPSCACWAIEQATPWPIDQQSYQDKFAALFRPRPIPKGFIPVWFGEVGRNTEAQRFRVLALCLMAAIAEEGDA